MKAEESLSGDSFVDGGRRFTGSSIASTPDNESLPRGNFIQFEEYGTTSNPTNPRSLKIRIEEQQQEASEQSSAREGPYEQQYQPDDHLQLIIDYRENIDRLSTRVITLEERLYYYEDYNRRLLKENEEVRAHNEEHCKQLRELERVLADHTRSYNLQKQLIDNLNRKIQLLEAEQGYMQGFAERLGVKDAKLRQLAKTLDKVLEINHTLEGELRQANLKIIDLEKESQWQSCRQIEQNLFKIKEQGGKENSDGNGGYRRSLKRGDRPVMFKTEPNQRNSDRFELYHAYRDY